MARTADQIINGCLTYLQRYQPSLDTSEGTVIRDVIESFAEELANLYVLQDTFSKYITFTDPETLDSGILDNIGQNYGITRRAESPSTGLVYFRSLTNGGSITIPAGTLVSTPSTTTATGITYSTDETIVLDATAVQDSTTGYYEKSVTVTCLTAGTAGNVGANTLTVIGTPIDGIIGVTNKLAITNGANTESNTDYVNRIKLYLSGTTLGTTDSYSLLFGSVTGVNSVLVIDPNSEFNERGPGAIDVYVDGETIETYTQTVPAATGPTGETEIELDKTPVLEVVGITGYVQDVDYELIKDTTSAYKYSVNAKDKIVWLTTAPIATYDIVYTYNKLIEDVQTVEQDPANHIITNDILVKSTVPVYINFEITAYKLAGYRTEDVRTYIVNAITEYIQTDRLGKNITQSALVDVINNTTGVDYVNVPFTRMSLRTGSGVQDLIVQNPYEYFDVDTASFNITVN